MTRPQYANGRILLRERGGVHRYATEVLSRLDSCTVLRPRSARFPWSARVWEQTGLPRSTGDGVLLNLAHSGPVRHPRQVTVVHDLLGLTHPDLINPAFAAFVKWQLPRLIRGATRIAAVSRAVADQTLAMFDVPGNVIEVVPPGISSVFRPVAEGAAHMQLGLDPERPVIAALLDPTPRKNSADVARLLREIQTSTPRVQVVVAGAERVAPFGRTPTAAPTVSRDGFLDLGAATDIELASMYQAADIFVSLTSGEGFGLPAVEAANCGAAVVTTPVPSISEYAPTAAVVIPTAQDARLAITRLLADPSRGRCMTAGATQPLGDLQWSTSAATLGAMITQTAAA